MTIFHVIKYPFPWTDIDFIWFREAPEIIRDEFRRNGFEMFDNGIMDIKAYRSEYERLLSEYEGEDNVPISCN